MKNLQHQKSEIEEILEKLKQRNSLLFNGITDVIYDKDDQTDRILVTVVETRKVIVKIENASTDTLSQPKYPDLPLCPICCSPEIPISQNNASSKCHYLECDKIWNIEINNIKVKRIENVWSLT